jgi:hypothetical protein
VGFFDWFRAEPEQAEAAVAGPPTPEQISAALDTMDARVLEAQLSSPVIARVRRITQRLRQTLPRMTNAGLTSVDQYSLIATATSYLPQTVSSYVRLPRDWADRRPVDAGRSSLLVLVDQLDLLGATIDKIYDAVIAKDAEALVVHGRFLAEKFTPGHMDARVMPAVAKPSATATGLDLG